MASFRDKGPREFTAPRRRTPNRDDSRRQQQHRRPVEDEFGSYGSEALSRNELFVPTAYAVRETPTAVAELVTAPADETPAFVQPLAPTVTELASSASSGREPERSVLDESASASGHSSHPPSSPTGTYSMYSDTYGDGRGGGVGGSHRHVGTREWAKHNEEASSRFTESSAGDRAHAWSGPGSETYDHDDDHHSRRGGGTAASVYTDDDSGGSSGWTYRTNDKGAPRRAERNDAEMLPPYPYTQQQSARSGMSHDLSGFSDVDLQPKGHKADLEDDEEFDSYAYAPGTGAAAAAAADSTNAAALNVSKAKTTDKAGVSGSGRRRPYLAPRLPHPDSSAVRDSGETKEEADLHDPKIDYVEDPSSAVGSRDGRGPPANNSDDNAGHHSTGEYAVVRYRTVFFTPIIFIICAIMLFWEFSLNDWEAESISDNPSYGPSVDVLIEAGAKRTDLIVDNGDWWRLWTPMFLHAGVIHFLFNMIGFLQVGAMVERVFGWWRVALIYLVAGVFGTIVSAIFVPLQVMVGASGAIFGVFGALWADLWQNWSVYSEKCQALSLLSFLTIVNVVLGLMPYLDNFAHIGGIVMGFFMGLGLLVQSREDDFGSRLSKKCYQRTLQLISLIGVPFLMILGLSLLYGRSDPDEWCGWCENISCVEFPPSSPWWACDECSTVGYTADVFENGTYVFECPDLSTVYTDDCGATTTAEVTECCVDVCL